MSSRAKKFKPFAIFCDDIRQEVNGKFILVGCYGQAMLIDSFPFQGRLAACAYVPAQKVLDCNVAIKLKSGGVIAEFNMKAEVPADIRFVQLPIPGAIFSVENPDTVIINIRVNDILYNELAELEIRAVDSLEIIDLQK